MKLAAALVAVAGCSVAQSPELPTHVELESLIRQAGAKVCPDCGPVVFAPSFEESFARTYARTGLSVIRFNPGYIDNLSRACGMPCSFGLMAHEYGHHVTALRMGNASSEKKELAADYVSGCMLRAMGMDPTPWMSVVLTFPWGAEGGYPGALDRAHSVRAGWLDCGDDSQADRVGP